MKIIPLMLICVAALTTLGAPASRALGEVRVRFTDPLTTLQHAPFFDMIGVPDESRSPGETALRALAQNADAPALFERVLADKRTSKAGQLYALLGLQWTAPTQFEQRIGLFLRDQSAVEVWRYGFVYRVPVSFIARQIVKSGGVNPFAPASDLETPFRLDSNTRYAPLYTPRFDPHAFKQRIELYRHRSLYDFGV